MNTAVRFAKTTPPNAPQGGVPVVALASAVAFAAAGSLLGYSLFLLRNGDPFPARSVLEFWLLVPAW
jgi:hypothetical protein